MMKKVVRFCLVIPVVFLATCTEEAPVEVVPVVENPTECLCEEIEVNKEENLARYYAVEDWFTGMCREYYEEGALKTERSYVNGQVHGKVITFYEDGTKQTERDFAENRQDGEFREWNEDGSLKYAARYAKGQFVALIEE